MSYPGNFGIIFQGTTGTPGTYVDVWGQTRDEVQLVSLTPVRMPTSVESAYPTAGLANKFTLTVDVVVNVADVTLTIQGHPDTDNTAAWADGVFAFADSDPTTNTTSRTFSTTGRYLLQTQNLAAVIQACILVTPGDDFDGSISVQLQALP